MSGSKALFEKANKAFQNGNIDKAMIYCEKSIAENINNSAAINLKGLIFYFKGDLDSAKCTWNLNLQRNKNSIAEQYLNNIDGDRILFTKYIKAIKLIEEYKISEAIGLLKECESSSFNSINLNLTLAKCYMKKGEITKTEYHLKKVVDLDKNNSDINEIEKYIGLYGGRNNSNYIKTLIFLATLIILIMVVLLGVKNKDYIKTKLNKIINKQENVVAVGEVSHSRENDSKDKETKKEDKSENDDINENKEDIEEEKGEDVEQQEVQVYNSDNLKKLIDEKSKDYDAIYKEYKAKENKEVRVEDEETIKKAENILKTKALEYFYEKSYDSRKNNNFQGSVDYLSKAEGFMEGSYLRPHILYFLGISYQKLGNIEETERYYDTYINDYPKGSYGSTAIYYLATYYEDKDLERAKNYASIIRNNYPKSKENNAVVSRILKK